MFKLKMNTTMSRFSHLYIIWLQMYCFRETLHTLIIKEIRLKRNQSLLRGGELNFMQEKQEGWGQIYCVVPENIYCPLPPTPQGIF